MKRNSPSTTLVIAFCALFVVGIVPALQADDHACSYRSVSGKWGHTSTGAILAGSLAGPVAAVGNFTLDRDGNVLDGAQTVSFNGTIADETFSGTYTVNDDCTAEATVVVVSPIAPRTTLLHLVFVDHSSEIRMVFRSPFTAITVNAKKLKND